MMVWANELYILAVTSRASITLVLITVQKNVDQIQMSGAGPLRASDLVFILTVINSAVICP